MNENDVMTQAAPKPMMLRASPLLPCHQPPVLWSLVAVLLDVQFCIIWPAWDGPIACFLKKMSWTSGSTWHAAGNCPNFVGSWTMMKIQSYSTKLYRELDALVDYPMNYHVTGQSGWHIAASAWKNFAMLRRWGVKWVSNFRKCPIVKCRIFTLFWKRMIFTVGSGTRLMGI